MSTTNSTHANTQIGHGCVLTFASGFFANVEDVSWDGISRGVVETTHMETSGGQTFLPEANYDPGNLSVTWQHDHDEIAPPLTSSAETCTLTFPDLTAKWAASAFMVDYGITCPDKDKMMASATLKFTGDIGFTAS